MRDSPPVDFVAISHDMFLAAIESLATSIEASGWQPDFIVGIGRGGLVPGTFLSHRCGIPLLSIDLSARVPEFAEALLHRLATRSQRGERYLLIDDINDSGKTIARLRGSLRSQDCSDENIRFAVLVDNVVSGERVDYSARTIDRRVDKGWLVFPWEAMAPRQTLAAEAAEDPDRLGLPRRTDGDNPQNL